MVTADALPNAVNAWEDLAAPRVAGTTYQAVTAFDGASGLSRDRRIVTSHWTDLTGTQSLATLASTLATGWGTWFGTSAHKLTVTIYLSDFAPAGTPHPPLAQAVNGASAVIQRGPGEVALCLSYFSTFNIKRNRGRIYIPFDMVYAAQISPTPMGPRPTASDQNTVLGVWNTVFQPVDHNTNWDWVLKSRADKQFKPITDVWVDNEWDTVRRRGLRGDSRVTAKT